MKIEQLRESQKNTLATLRKNSVLKVYIPIVGANKGVTAVSHGISSNPRATDEGVHQPSFPVSIDPEFSFHAGDIVLSIITTPVHLRPPKRYKNKEDVAKAEKMFPDSHYPLLSYSLSTEHKTALLDGTIAPSNIKEIFITGFDATGNKIKRGTSVLPVSPKQLNRWYVNSYMRNIKIGGHEKSPPKHASPYYSQGDTLGNRNRN